METYIYYEYNDRCPVSSVLALRFEDEEKARGRWEQGLVKALRVNNMKEAMAVLMADPEAMYDYKRCYACFDNSKGDTVTVALQKVSEIPSGEEEC